MNFDLSEEQHALRESLHSYLRSNYQFEQRQATVAGPEPFDRALWQECADLGWLALPFAPEQGGLGGSAIELMLLFEQCGRFLVVEPFLETLLMAGGVLKRVRGDDIDTRLNAIIAGRTQGALAHGEPQHCDERGSVRCTATYQGGAFALSGRKAVIYNAPTADFFIVSATADAVAPGLARGDLCLFLVDSHQPGLALTPYQTVDGRCAAEVNLNGASVDSHRLVCSGDKAEQLIRAVFDDVTLALAAESIGAMDVLVSETARYISHRKQFGRPIAEFQSLQHSVADMYMASELARSLVYAAAIKLREGAQDASLFLAAAKAKADKSGVFVAHNAIQLHGGIATTDELKIGHYLKRITVSANLYGSRASQVRRFWQARCEPSKQCSSPELAA
ncbi:MAG: acyl-CoA dehydrogenase family protein [Pseudomonadota bacterium]